MATKSVKITTTWEQLATMRDNNLRYIWTPGASEPYLNSQASFSRDEFVADYMDFVRAEGFDMLSDEDDGLTYDLTINYPF